MAEYQRMLADGEVKTEKRLINKVALLSLEPGGSLNEASLNKASL